MAKAKQVSGQVTMDQRSGKDRRQNSDRRTKDAPVAVERRQAPRRKVARRRQIDPTTCERDYSNDEVEFMQSLDAYKRRSGRMFPTCSEILEVVRDLGYVKLATPSGATPVEISADSMAAVEDAETPAADKAPAAESGSQ